MRLDKVLCTKLEYEDLTCAFFLHHDHLASHTLNRFEYHDSCIVLFSLFTPFPHDSPLNQQFI